ncbi:hypothetical protein cypCar_00004523 [Cyprinus carpio]|nr:hypothetical protein cypCar_00004523 [Cyprinus carpio]
MDDSARASRDRFLDTLQEHIHDAHSHVRACVLQVYARIVNSKALPLCRYTEVMELTVGCLGDKSVHVCKSAIQLLAAFIAHNPYSCKCGSEKEMAKLKEMRDTQKEQVPVAVITDLWDAMKPEVEMTMKAQLEPGSEEEEDKDEQTEGKEERSERDTALQIAQLLREGKYRKAVGLCMRAHSLFPESSFFSDLADLNAETLINTLATLFKGPEQETPEAMSSDAPPTPQKEGGESELKKQEMLVQYLKDTESFALQVERAIAVINNMLYWKTTTVVQEAMQFCVTAFEFGVADSVCGVRKMLPLVWSTDVTIKDAVIQAHRRLYLNPPVTTPDLMIDASLGTVQCLEEIVTVQEFFSSESALQTSQWCRFFGRGSLVNERLKHFTGEVQYYCWAWQHGVVQSDPHWQTFMEQAVRLIYFLAESPDQMCSRLLQRSSHLLLEQITEGGEPNQSQLQEVGSQGSEEQVNCVSLAQVLSLCGAVAFWQVSHLERSVSSELRRRRGEKEEKEEKEKAPANKKEANDSCVEEELGLVGASAEDTEVEFIRKICETELLAEGNMLSAFLPLLVKVCSSPGKYSHPQLTTAACLALSQYMMISLSVCKDNIRLQFTVLEKSPLSVVKANTIVALGDLTVRFPNILEPWTPKLYAR